MRRSQDSSTDGSLQNNSDPRTTSRRSFLVKGAAAAAGAFALGCSDQFAGGPYAIGTDRRANLGLPQNPNESPIEHIIVVMMENRSFDHMMGWVPGADGRNAGLKYFDARGNKIHTYPLAPDYQGCGHADPDHSFSGGRIQFNNGACDGFLLGGNDIYAIGYYDRKDLDFFAPATQDWTVPDHYFCSILGPTFPNRFYQHAAQTDRISNTLVLSTLPTIWDSLAQAGLTGRYFFSDLAFTALWGAKYLPITQPITAFFQACATGNLPHLSFVDPKFSGEEDGTSTDDHPFGDVRAGQHFMHQIYTAVANSPAWSKTVLIFNYDEWGGFFDHVPPPVGAVSAIDVASGNVDGRLGFRTPVLVISPYAQSIVPHGVYDHTSILKMVEWRWGLSPLAARDASANNLAEVLDHFSAPRPAPQYPVPPVVIGTPCPVPSAVTSASLQRTHWRGLRTLNERYGFELVAS